MYQIWYQLANILEHLFDVELYTDVLFLPSHSSGFPFASFQSSISLCLRNSSFLFYFSICIFLFLVTTQKTIWENKVSLYLGFLNLS